MINSDNTLPTDTAQFSSAFKRDEEAKRDRNWNPEERWQVLLHTIAWAEQQQAVRRNTREECLRRQAKHWHRMAEQSDSDKNEDP